MVIYPSKRIMEVNIALLTVTDTRTIENDKSGEILVKKITEQKHKLVDRKIVKDNKEEIKEIILEWTKKDQIDVIITTGGTGLTGRDITPEVLDEIADKKIPGFGELFRQLSYKTVGTSTLQSRACAILKNGKYIFALPGSPGGVTDAWNMILKYQLDINHKPCNFVELFPRLKEK
jgi:molybdenum cofactor biosynthesis protein B